jgi:hypothetical protein
MADAPHLDVLAPYSTTIAHNWRHTANMLYPAWFAPRTRRPARGITRSPAPRPGDDRPGRRA